MSWEKREMIQIERELYGIFLCIFLLFSPPLSLPRCMGFYRVELGRIGGNEVRIGGRNG